MYIRMLGEQLTCNQEPGNCCDTIAAASVIKNFSYDLY